MSTQNRRFRTIFARKFRSKIGPNALSILSPVGARRRDSRPVRYMDTSGKEFRKRTRFVLISSCQQKCCLVAGFCNTLLPMKIIYPREARALGLMWYFTGKPCRHGHIAKRYLSGGCVLCHRGHARISRKKTYDPQEAAAWYQMNRESAIAKSVAYQVANPEKRRKNQKRWFKTERGQSSRKAGAQRRRARKKDAINTFSPADWRALVARSSRCHWCKKPFNATRRRTHDHVIPLAKGGHNTIENSCCACVECNSRKRDRLVNPLTGQGILV